MGCGKNGKYYIPLYTMPLDITQTIPADSGTLACGHTQRIEHKPRARSHRFRWSYFGGDCAEGVLFVTYSMLVSKTTRKKKNYSRFNQLVKWCGPDFEGCIGNAPNNVCRVRELLWQ